MVEKEELKGQNLKKKLKNLSLKTRKLLRDIKGGIKYRKSFLIDIDKLDDSINKISKSIEEKKTKKNSIKTRYFKTNSTPKKPTSVDKTTNKKPTSVDKTTTKKPTSVDKTTNKKPTSVDKTTNKNPVNVKNNKEPEEIVIYIPADREENKGNTRGNMRRDIEEIRKEKINHFLKNVDKKSKLVKFNFDLKPPNKEDSIQVQENYISLIITNLIEFKNTFCFFKYSGKEKENYESYKSDANFKKEKVLQKLEKAKKKYNKNKTDENKQELEDAEYKLEQIEIELEFKKKNYEDFEKNPNKLANLVFNKLVNVKQEQSINNKKLYAYEILGFDELGYKKIIDMCIDLRNSKIKDIDLKASKKKITKNDEKKFIKYNDIVNGYLKSMLDTLQNKKIVYKIKKTITNKKDKLKVPPFYYNNKTGRLKKKSS